MNAIEPQEAGTRVTRSESSRASRSSSAPTTMSCESIVCERRSDLRGDARDDLVENGLTVGPRLAFEQRRSSMDGDARVGAIPSRAVQKEVEGKERKAPRSRYRHRFFSEEVAACRKKYLKILARATILTILLTWATLPIYWGSLSASAGLTGKLEAWVINRDQARIGDSFKAAVVDAPTSGRGALWWRLINATYFPTEEDVVQAVLQERTWLAIVVNANATTNLGNARATGNTSYDPSSAITVYYTQARNEIATGTYLLPAATNFLSNFSTNYATSSAQRFFAAVVADDGTVNVTALIGIAQAPQTISPAVGYGIVNLRPYTAPVAQAPLVVGQIYLCIFAFIIVMAHTTARTQIEPFLNFPSYLTLRLAAPLIVYLPLSLSYALVNVAFHLPFHAHFTSSTGSAQGFLAFFGIVYLGMASLGLALEAMVTLLGPKFVPLFLVLLIITNVSTAALPPELQPRVYAYGSGFQFWNIQQAVRTILFNTYSHLPKNAGILIAWTLISCGTTAVFTWLIRMRDLRKTQSAVSPDRMSGERPGERWKLGDEESAVVSKGKLIDDEGKGKSTSVGAGGNEEKRTAFERWESMKVKNLGGEEGDSKRVSKRHETAKESEKGSDTRAEVEVEVVPSKS